MSKMPPWGAGPVGEEWQDFCRICKDQAVFRVAPNGQMDLHPLRHAPPPRRVRHPCASPTMAAPLPAALSRQAPPTAR